MCVLLDVARHENAETDTASSGFFVFDAEPTG